MSYGKMYEIKEVRLTWWAARADGIADTAPNNANAVGQFIVKTDYPGPSLTTRLTAILELTNGRKTDSWPMDGYKARQIQVRFVPGSTGELVPYEGSALVRPLGLFLEGVNGDVWETQPISLGV